MVLRWINLLLFVALIGSCLGVVLHDSLGAILYITRLRTVKLFCCSCDQLNITIMYRCKDRVVIWGWGRVTQSLHNIGTETSLWHYQQLAGKLRQWLASLTTKLIDFAHGGGFLNSLRKQLIDRLHKFRAGAQNDGVLTGKYLCFFCCLTEP